MIKLKNLFTEDWWRDKTAASQQDYKVEFPKSTKKNRST